MTALPPDIRPTRLQRLRVRLADSRYRWARRRARAAARIFRRGTLSIVGLACLAAAAYTVSLTAGLAATGVAALLADWRVVE
jgi:hypothetical protein